MSKYIDTGIIYGGDIDGIDGNDLVFYTDQEKNIYSGGFNVNSIIMKAGLSPFSTLNKINNQTGGNVSDLFEGLVVPSWLLSQENKFNGGFNGGFNRGFNKKNKSLDSDEDEDEVVSDDIHNKLLEFVTFNDNKNKHKKTKRNKNINKNINKNKNTKKNI